MTPLAYLQWGGIAVGILALGGAFAGYTVHERGIGEQKIEAADQRAREADKKRAEAETALNLAKAKKADEGADRAQAAVDQYRHDHPEQPIRLCRANGSVGVPSPGGASAAVPGGPSARPAAIPEVPKGGASEGPDIAPEFDALVSAAARLAVLYGNLQQRR